MSAADPDAPFPVSGRVGPRGRTFHVRVQSVGRATGSVARAVEGLDYDAREGAHVARRDELESADGTPRDEMARLIESASLSNPRKNAKFVLKLQVELPAAFNPHQRREAAESVAAWFESKGCACHWAVHGRNEAGLVQPHLHMTVTARPVVNVGGHTIVAPPRWHGKRVPPAIDGPKDMHAFRRQVVPGVINGIAQRDRVTIARTQDGRPVPWHGGRLRETGIARPAKKRRPMIVYKAAERATAPDRGLAKINALIDAGAFVTVTRERQAWVERAWQQREERRAAKKAEKKRRRRERLAKLGAVDARDATIALAQAKAEAERFRFSARAWRERAEAPPRTVEVMKEIKVPVEPPEEQRPATARQVATLFDLARKHGLVIDPAAPMTIGTVGATIRHLMDHARAQTLSPQSKPAERQRPRQPSQLTHKGLER